MKALYNSKDKSIFYQYGYHKILIDKQKEFIFLPEIYKNIRLGKRMFLLVK